MARTTTTHEDEDMSDIVKKEMVVEMRFDTILDYIQSNFTPDEIFDNGELEEWAEKNGYTRI